MPFWETTLLRKQFTSPILFGLSKSGKKNVVLNSLGDRKMHILAIEKSINRNVSVRAGFASYSSKLFVDFRKVDLSTKLLEKILVLCRYILARLLIYNFTKSD